MHRALAAPPKELSYNALEGSQKVKDYRKNGKGKVLKGTLYGVLL